MLAANKYGASNYGHPANKAAFAMGMADAAGDMLLEQQDEHLL